MLINITFREINNSVLIVSSAFKTKHCHGCGYTHMLSMMENVKGVFLKSTGHRPEKKAIRLEYLENNLALMFHNEDESQRTNLH